MRRTEICFDVNDLDGQNFKDFYGAHGMGAIDEREGTYLAAYVLENSLDQDALLDAIKAYMGTVTIYRYASPYANENNELLYIVRIKD